MVFRMQSASLEIVLHSRDAVHIRPGIPTNASKTCGIDLPHLNHPSLALTSAHNNDGWSGTKVSQPVHCWLRELLKRLTLIGSICLHISASDLRACSIPSCSISKMYLECHHMKEIASRRQSVRGKNILVISFRGISLLYLKFNYHQVYIFKLII